jgi:aldehyde dehydrogenase family 7 member A1
MSLFSKVKLATHSRLRPTQNYSRWIALGSSHKRAISTQARGILDALDLSTTELNQGVFDGEFKGSGDIIDSINPSTGEILGRVIGASPSDMTSTLSKSREAYTSWRILPAPQRGQVLATLRDLLQSNLRPLGSLISLEMGKPLSEGLGSS